VFATTPKHLRREKAPIEQFLDDLCCTMSGSTSFGKKGSASIDATAVADVSPVSESDEIYVPSKPSTSKDQQKKVKKKAAETKAEGRAEGDAKTGTGAGGSQVSPRYPAGEVLALTLVQRRTKLLVHPRHSGVDGAH
jgi:hypothetical protein